MFNIVSQLQMRGIDVKQSPSNENEFRICCPFCVSMGTSPDFRFRLGFNIESGLASCFNCGWRSRKAILELVKEFGLGDEALEQVQVVHYTKQTRERSKPVRLPEGFQLLSEIEEDDDLFGSARRYVNERGITLEQLERHEIGATVSDWRFGYRVIFPVRDKDEKLLGYTGRDWTGRRDPKYLLSEGNKSVYNARPDLYPARIVVLSEGVTKSLAIERAVRNMICSAAVFGHTLSDTQMGQLKGFEEVCLFPDPDTEGLKGFLAVGANIATQFSKVSMVWPWPEQQADEMTHGEIKKLICGRRPYSELLQMQCKMEMMKR